MVVGPQCLLEYYKVTGEVQTDIDGVKHVVRDRKRAGVDFIKTATTGGVLWKGIKIIHDIIY